MTYYITAGICLFLLVMMPIWTARPDQPHFPLGAILALAAIVVIVPLIFRRRDENERG